MLGYRLVFEAHRLRTPYNGVRKTWCGSYASKVCAGVTLSRVGQIKPIVM